MKESFEKTRHVKNINKSKKQFLRGQRNMRHYEKIPSNKRISYNFTASNVQKRIWHQSKKDCILIWDQSSDTTIIILKITGYKYSLSYSFNYSSFIIYLYSVIWVLYYIYILPIISYCIIIHPVICNIMIVVSDDWCHMRMRSFVDWCHMLFCTLLAVKI